MVAMVFIPLSEAVNLKDNADLRALFLICSRAVQNSHGTHRRMTRRGMPRATKKGGL
jgi:hypothetical protein